jgi:hypothetical protein
MLLSSRYASDVRSETHLDPVAQFWSLTMKRTLFFVLLLASLGLTATADDAERKAAKPQALKTLEQMTTDLKEARELLKKAQTQETREKIELLITRSELAAKELQKDFLAMAKAVAMEADDFDKVLKALKANSFDDGKLKFVKSMGKTARITSAQAKQLLASFSFDKDRTEAALVVHPLVIDPALFGTALDAFTFESSRKQVLEKLNAK